MRNSNNRRSRSASYCQVISSITPPPPPKKKMQQQQQKRIGRKGDPRMEKAVIARLANPQLPLYEALLMGGFEYTEDPQSVDDQGVTLCQRKNQLSRRIRMAKKKQSPEAPSSSSSTTTTTTTTSTPSPPADFRHDLAIRLFLVETRSLYQKCMLLAGYQAHETTPASIEDFALAAHHAEGQRLQPKCRASDKACQKPTPQGHCGHKPVLHQPKNGQAHIDFLVHDVVECYHHDAHDAQLLPVQDLALDEWNFDLSDDEVTGLVQLTTEQHKCQTTNTTTTNTCSSHAAEAHHH